MRVTIGSIAAKQKSRTIGIVKKTIPHDHVVAIPLEIEGLPVATAKTDGNKTRLAILEILENHSKSQFSADPELQIEYL